MTSGETWQPYEKMFDSEIGTWDVHEGDIFIAHELAEWQADRIIADHAAAQREATERERADRAERELESEERNASYHLGRWQKAIAERDALRRTVQSLSDVSAEQVAELATERAAAEALAVDEQKVGQLEERLAAGEQAIEELRAAFATYHASHQPSTGAQG